MNLNNYSTGPKYENRVNLLTNSQNFRRAGDRSGIANEKQEVDYIRKHSKCEKFKPNKESHQIVHTHPLANIVTESNTQEY